MASHPEQENEEWRSARRETVIVALCNKMIDFKDPWAATMCKLRAGHDGDCSPLYPDEYR